MTLVQVDMQFSLRYKLAGDEISQGTKMLYYQMILSRNRLSVGISVKVPQNLISLEIYQGTARGQFKPQEAFLLTARQYGEVVLPDASTGLRPGSLARKLSRCKEGMAHFLPSGYKFF